MTNARRLVVSVLGAMLVAAPLSRSQAHQVDVGLFGDAGRAADDLVSGPAGERFGSSEQTRARHWCWPGRWR